MPLPWRVTPHARHTGEKRVVHKSLHFACGLVDRAADDIDFGGRGPDRWFRFAT